MNAAADANVLVVAEVVVVMVVLLVGVEYSAKLKVDVVKIRQVQGPCFQGHDAALRRCAGRGRR